MKIFTARRHARMAYVVALCQSLFVCHKSQLYKNSYRHHYTNNAAR